MGKLATVVYDAVKHVPLVVRTRTSSPAERFGVLDAVAAFAHHCESLRGVARSHVHVSALWGGPPFLTYLVVRARFRVIVMWVDAPGDFDTAQDVEEALVELHKAVIDVADGMLAADPAAVSHVYAVAGAVLENDHGFALAQTAAPTLSGKKSSSLLASTAMGKLPRAGSSSSVTPSYDSEPPSTGKKGKFLRGLLKGGGGVRKRNGSSKKSAADDAESNAISMVDSESLPFDESLDDPSVLQLPEEVFAFSDFGAPLPDSAGDLAWIGDLIQGYEKPKSLPEPASMRAAAITTSDFRDTSTDSGQKPDANGALAAAAVDSAPLAAVEASGSGAPVEPGDAAFAAGRRESAARPPLVPSAPVAHPPQAAVPEASPVQPVRAAPPPPALSTTLSDVPEVLQGRDADEFDVGNLGGVRDEASLRQATESVSSTDSATTISAATSDAIRRRMNEFANTMQTGNYPLALQQVVGTLQGLCKISPVPRREIVACASYLQALKILIRVRVLEGELAQCVPNSPDAIRRALEMALLTMFLAEMKNLLPRHSVAGKKMAVEKNFVVGNFGMAARWLRALIQAAPPPQKAVFAQRLELCVQNKELNTHMPPTKYLCFSTLSVIVGTPLKCKQCQAFFAASGAGALPRQSCPICYSGTVDFA